MIPVRLTSLVLLLSVAAAVPPIARGKARS